MRRSFLPLVLIVLSLGLRTPLWSAAAAVPAVAPPPAGPAADAGERDPADFPRPAGLVRQSFQQQPGVQRTVETATYHAGSGLDEIAGRYREALDAAGWKMGPHSDIGTGPHRVMIVDWDRAAREAEIRFYGAKEGADLWVRVFTYPARASAATKAAEVGTPGAPAVVVVPDVLGRPMGVAEAILYDAQLNVAKGPGRLDRADSIRDARVAEQSPAAGQKVARGFTVTIIPWIATGRVPDVVGRPVDEAKRTLTGVPSSAHGAHFTVEVGPAQPNPDRLKDGIVAEQSPAAGERAALHSAVTIIPWAGLAPVPNVVGKHLSEAKTLLTGAGPGGAHGGQFAVAVGPGKPTPNRSLDDVVAEQSPAAGTPAPLHSTVTLTPWAGLTPVPDVVGQPVAQAKTHLAGTGPGGGHGVHFAVAVGTAQPTADRQKDDTVAEQSPAAGERAPAGSTVTLIPWVEMAPVPNVVGRSVADAKALLTGASPGGGHGVHFAVEVGPAKPTTNRSQDGRVAEQSPAAGQQAPVRSTVTVIPWGELCPVPDVVGKPLNEARMMLRQGGPGGSFVVQTGEPRPTLDKGREGIVAAQDPHAGATATRGSTVTLTVYALQTE